MYGCCRLHLGSHRHLATNDEMVFDMSCVSVQHLKLPDSEQCFCLDHLAFNSSNQLLSFTNKGLLPACTASIVDVLSGKVVLSVAKSSFTGFLRGQNAVV